jgi:outer membrane receptor protein involved in Fe transport
MRTGCQTSDVPFTIADKSSKTGQLYGVYLQDEWKLTPTLTLNYGARFDVVHAFTHESAAQPARQPRVAPARSPPSTSAMRAPSRRRRRS